MVDDVTLGEVARRLTALEGGISRQFDTVNRRLDNLQFVSHEIYTVEMKLVTDRLRQLEEDKQWTRRTIVGAFLFPVLVALTVMVVVIAV